MELRNWDVRWGLEWGDGGSIRDGPLVRVEYDLHELKYMETSNYTNNHPRNHKLA
jgi:hypothetical protein